VPGTVPGTGLRTVRFRPQDAAPPIVVVVTGPPASGKSTIAAELAERAGLPLLAKDPIKEILFDVFGWSDRAWSRRLGIATYPVLYELARSALTAGRSLVLEANFDNERARVELRGLGAPRMLQVFCTAPPDVLVKRYAERTGSGVRHAAHGTLDAELEARIRGDGFGPVDLDCARIDVYTEPFDDVRLDEVEAAIGPLSEPAAPLPRVGEEAIAQRLRESFGDDDRVGEAARRIASLY
jgi:predicted kinase